MKMTKSIRIDPEVDEVIKLVHQIKDRSASKILEEYVLAGLSNTLNELGIPSKDRPVEDIIKDLEKRAAKRPPPPRLGVRF